MQKIQDDKKNVQNEMTNFEQDINKEEVYDSELLQSRQFSMFKKSNYQQPEEIVRYESQIVESDEEDQIKGSDQDDEEKEVKAWTLKTRTTTLSQCEQIQLNNAKKDGDIDNLKPLDFEEILKQSQINFSRQTFKMDDTMNKSSLRSVIITQVDSEDDEEELADQVFYEIGALQNQEREITADNRIMMSAMQSKFSQSIQKQQKLQQSLNNQSKINQQDDIFKSKIVFINKTPMIIREDDVYIRKIRKIQNQFKFVKPFKKLKKQHRYRANIINELIQTEKNYVSDLNSIREHIQKPLLSLLIDSQNHVKFMFNLDSIYHFNFEFLKILLNIEQSVKKKPYFKIMDEITLVLPGFKFYFDYCKEFQASKKMREQYSNTNQVYKQFFIDFLEKQPNFFNNLDLESYLIKPVQRLPKYILLFRDLLKHTNKDHPDYINIEQCLKLFQQINDKNNSQIKTYLEQIKLGELQNQFRQYVLIAEPNRVYCFEEFCSIYTDKRKKNIILYAFNNLLLFAQIQQNGEQVYCFHLHITYQSYIKDKENTVYFEHFFEVVNKTESIIIINQDNESKISLITKIQDIISQLKQKQINMQNLKKSTSLLTEIGDGQQDQQQQNLDYEIKVFVIGTDIRSMKSNPYTVYIVQIFIQEYQTKIFVRYSQIVSLQLIVNKFDSSLKVPMLSKLNWFLSIDSKVIEERKLLIEKLLSSVLNSQQCQNTFAYQQQILKLLNLNQDFFWIPYKKNQTLQVKLEEEDIMKIILQSQFSCEIKPNLLQSMIMQRKSNDIIQAANAQAQRSSLPLFQQDNSIVIGEAAIKSPYSIEVSLTDGRTITVGFKKPTLTLFIKNKVAKFVGLKQWLDFRLFIIDQNKDLRVIDDSETMSSILDVHLYQNEGIINAFRKLFTNEQKFKFIFKKYIYLQWKQEEADYKQDQQRLNYIIYDIIWEVRNKKFQFNFNEFCLITALFFYSSNISQDQLCSLMYKVIPKNYLKSKKEEVWLKEIVNNINSLQFQLKQITKEDQLIQIQKNQKCDTSIKGLAQLMIMNYFKSNFLLGMQQFFVECNKQTIPLVQQNFNIKINNNIFIGLNYNGFHILNPENKILIYTCQYGKLSEMKTCTTEFSCIIDSTKLSFKTQFSFEIKSLILDYKQLQEFTKQLAYGVN